MKILDRYIIKGFLAPFGVCTLIFSVLVLMGRYFDKSEIFNSYHAKAKDILVFLLLGLPYWLNIVLPVATLLALLFALGQFQQRRELTACRGAGISLRRLLAPYLVIGFLLSIFSLIGGLSFLPKIDSMAHTVYRVKIKSQNAVNYKQDRVVMAGENHRRFTIDWLDVQKQQMKNVVMDRFDDQSQWVESISARESDFIDGKWRFFDGVWRHADPAHPGEVIENPFAQQIFDIPEKPADFALEDKEPDDMTGHEIILRIHRLRELGVSVDREWVALNMKVALPFANMVVIALGIPFALRAGQDGRTQTFTYALAMAFLYWGLTSVFQSIGEQGRLPAWIAAWLSNVIFSLIAMWRLSGLIG